MVRSMIIEAVACVRKYFVAASVDRGFFLLVNSGIIARRLISNPTQHNTHFIIYKTWISSIPLLTARSHPRDSHTHWPNFINMTKNCPTINFIPNLPTPKPNYHNHHRNLIYLHRCLRRTKPNTNTKNYSILINCPYRMNISNSPIQP